MNDAHARAADEVARALGVSLDRGLSTAEAVERLSRVGRNAVEELPHPSVWTTLLGTLREPFILLLAAAGIGAVLLGETRDGLLVLAGLVPIIGADVITSYRSERAMEALRTAAAPTAHVLRDAAVVEVPATGVVPGDVLVLRAGDVVAADARVTETVGLQLDRSMLTGESVPEAATTDPDVQDTPLADRRSVVYAGTNVVGGRGRAIATVTGPATEFGRIATRLVSRQARSPLQRELDRLVRILLVAAGALIAFTVISGFLRGQPAGANLLAGISAAIAAIPEEPPVLVAVVLGLGAFRLLRRGVLVRRLSAQETLGAVDLIITDKTGTLTHNRLEVSRVLTPEGPLTGEARAAALVDALCAEEDAWDGIGGGRLGSFSSAILQAIRADGTEPALDRSRLRRAHGVESGRPYSAACLADPDGGPDRELAIGAGEALLPAAAADWAAALSEESASGRRAVLLAERPVDDAAGWRPRAIISFADALRPDVAAAVAIATRAGIQTVIVTGDHLATADAIGREAGLSEGGTWTGTEIDALADDRIREELATTRIVARAVPEQKLRLVDLARAAGRTVAVTGDGVNDAPALQRADVAVAMGSGTAVARASSDLVLGDDSFATLLGALREGRRIVTNVQKGLVFLVSTHVALLGFIFVATAAGFSQPLIPLQILWLELFIDLSASVAFEREPEEPGAMDLPPRRPDRPLLSREILVRIAGTGAFSAFAALGILLFHPGPFEHARWVAYTALVIGQVARAYANRSLVVPVHRLGLNRFLAATAVLVLLLQVAIPFVPPLADAFRATPLTGGEWLVVAAIALLPALVAEGARTLRPGLRWVA
ncbi:MAG TPA: HAD-IC family P-type ATPase [Candidatus Limnocylindria bacterium]